jgi:hypothetical protein
MGRRGYGSGESSAIRLDLRGLSNIDQRIRNKRDRAVYNAVKAGSRSRRPGVLRALSLVRAKIMAGSSSNPMSDRSAQSHDWDTRATEVIAQARKCRWDSDGATRSTKQGGCASPLR